MWYICTTIFAHQLKHFEHKIQLQTECTSVLITLENGIVSVVSFHLRNGAIGVSYYKYNLTDPKRRLCIWLLDLVD